MMRSGVFLRRLRSRSIARVDGRGIRYSSSKRGGHQYMAWRSKGKVLTVASATTFFATASVVSAGSSSDEDRKKSTTLFAVGAVLGLGALYAASKWGSDGGDASALKKAENALKKGRFAKTERIARNILKKHDLDKSVRADAYSILAAVLLQTDREFESLDAIESSIELRLSSSVSEENKIDADSIRIEREALIETLKRVGLETGAAEHAGRIYAKTVDMFGERGDKSGGAKSLGRAIAISTLIEEASSPDELQANVLEGKLHRLLHGPRKDVKQEADAFLDAVRNVAIGYGYEHPTVPLVMRDAANALFRAGDQDGARNLLNSAMAIQDKILEMSDPARAQTLKQLGEFALFVDKKPRDAMKYLKDAMTLMTMQYGSGHPHVDEIKSLIRQAQEEAYKM